VKVAALGIAMVMLASAAPPPLYPSALYIVREATSDFGPGWFHYVMIVKPDGDDVLVKLVRVAPLDYVCPRVVTVKKVEARLRGTSIAALIKDNNPCAISSERAQEEIRSHSRGSAVDDDVAIGIVSMCRGKEVVQRFPYGALLDTKKLPRQVRRLRELSWDIQKIAFGDRRLFYEISEAEDEQLQVAGRDLVDELKSQGFDKGFANGESFARDLADYRGVVRSKVEQFGELENAASYRFAHYEPAKYPPLAQQARIMGKVELDLLVDPASGEVKDVVPYSGHALLIPPAERAVKLWRFEPGSVSDKIRAVVDFQFRCPIGGTLP
jgi:Gram-negative bacterial TonB protein C-terminal